MLALSLILIGILLRFAPHAPNFTPVAAIALFSGVYLNKKYALLIPLILMIASDFFMGFHDVILFTWGGFALITLLGVWMKKRKNIFSCLYMAILSSVLFYLISNFGVWVAGWYPRNLNGLVTSYIMALPFLRTFTLSTLLYTALFFAAYELIASRVKDSKYSKALLTI